MEIKLHRIGGHCRFPIMPKSFVDELLKSDEISDELCPSSFDDSSEPDSYPIDENYDDNYGDNYPDYANNYGSNAASIDKKSSSSDNSYGNY